MKWEIKRPEKWRHLPGMHEHNTVFCAATDQGEYAILERSGKFGVYLDAVAVTGFAYNDAPTAIRHAEDLNIEIRNAMSSPPSEPNGDG